MNKLGNNNDEVYTKKYHEELDKVRNRLENVEKMQVKLGEGQKRIIGTQEELSTKIK